MADDALVFDPESLTIGELEDLEDRLGVGLETILAQLQEPGGRSARLLRAVVWITQRRTDPSFSWEDAGAVKVVEAVVPHPPVAGADA